MSPPLLTSAIDLTTDLNVIQARHELHRAADFGGEAELAAWARKWGESAMALAQSHSGMGYDDDDFNAHYLLRKAKTAHGALTTAAAKLLELNVKSGALDQIRTAQNANSDIITYLEEGE